MNKLVNFMLAGLGSAAIFSCTMETPERVDGPIRFTISTDPFLDTKAFPESENAIRENQINTVDFFIYRNGDLSQAAYYGHIDTDAVHETEFVVDMPGADYAALVADGAPLLYAVANLPESTHIPSRASLDAVKNTVVVANFAGNDSQYSLVMSGQKELTLGAAGAQCDIVVERVAAKVSFDITTDPFVYEDPDDPTSTKWFSHPEAMVVEFMNLGSQSIVDGDISAVSGSGIFSFPAGGLRSQYYTYPREWEYGMEDEPYLFITMPITKDSENGARRDCYYKVVFTNKKYESNHWYRYSIDLRMIGSFEREVPQVPTPKDASFFVYQWGGVHGYAGNATEGQITGFRYLTVEENSPTKVYCMYNVDDLVIPFKSSHDCEIIDIAATSPNYNVTTLANQTFDRRGDISISIDGSDLKIHHALNNDTSSGQGYSASHRSGYDFAPITITFSIKHSTDDAAEDAKFTENIRIVQYPALYIEATENSVGGTYGGAFVNTKQRTVDYGSLPGASSGDGNRTTRMYVIHISVLSNGDRIGDPRSRTSNTLSVTQRSARAIEGGASRYLKFYYPTDTDASTRNIIAPVFRNASSYGVTASLSWSDAQRRCATYQEDGFPAGRWRLPTKAEIEYINKLSYDGLFPKLYSDDTNYWCAHGVCRNGVVTVGNYTASSTYVRCVYDEWYWSNSAYPRIGEGSRGYAYWGDAEVF